jgi:hypothetical protein
VSADIQYFAVSNRVYFLSNNVGIHFLFTYYFPIRSFRLVPMFSGSTPTMAEGKQVKSFTSEHFRVSNLINHDTIRIKVKKKYSE